MKNYENQEHEGNSEKYKTGRKCIEVDCSNIAGTAWSAYWCFYCNVKRMRSINKTLEEIKHIFKDSE